jgi:hypothetical protein
VARKWAGKLQGNGLKIGGKMKKLSFIQAESFKLPNKIKANAIKSCNTFSLQLQSGRLMLLFTKRHQKSQPCY